MPEHDRKNWRELCNEAIAANDTDELLNIIERLNAELEREEKTRLHLTGNRVATHRQGPTSSMNEG